MMKTIGSLELLVGHYDVRELLCIVCLVQWYKISVSHPICKIEAETSTHLNTECVKMDLGFFLGGGRNIGQTVLLRLLSDFGQLKSLDGTISQLLNFVLI